jgi:hypothetical protein
MQFAIRPSRTQRQLSRTFSNKRRPSRPQPAICTWRFATCYLLNVDKKIFNPCKSPNVLVGDPDVFFNHLSIILVLLQFVYRGKHGFFVLFSLFCPFLTLFDHNLTIFSSIFAFSLLKNHPFHQPT